MKITVVGLGYVGLSNAILLALNEKVVGVDVDQKKVSLINAKKSPLKDKEIVDYLKNEDLDLFCKTDGLEDYKDSDYVIIAVPTNYDEEEGFFDTSLVENVISDVKKVNDEAIIVIKSTIPIGFTKEMEEKYGDEKIIFSPEFLREGRALYDCLNPSRIIFGGDKKYSEDISKAFLKASKNDPQVFIMGKTEAEAVKLFANNFLAMRISFFNELDSFAEKKGLDTRNIIDGVCADPRIGDHYNNPSFGYGGYCLPKDTKQLYANFKDVPNSMFGAIIDSNKIRKDFVSQSILDKNPETLGIYRLTMKTNSDNFRKSAIFDVIENLKKEDINIIVYEPSLDKDEIEGLKVVNDLDEFKKSDLIVANRIEKDLEDVKDKVYTRDIYKRD